MQQLHLIQNQLSFSDFNQQFVRLVSEDDSLLFLNDSVYSLLKNEFSTNQFETLAAKISICLIDEHINARNISALCNDFRIIDYPEFVGLSLKASKVLSW